MQRSFPCLGVPGVPGQPVTGERVRIVVAPDKFKGSLSAADVARAMAAGVRSVRADAEVDECPVADGGEGTVAGLVAATGGRFEHRTVTGPLPDMRVEATTSRFAQPIAGLGFVRSSSSGNGCFPPSLRDCR